MPFRRDPDGKPIYEPTRKEGGTASPAGETPNKANDATDFHRAPLESNDPLKAVTQKVGRATPAPPPPPRSTDDERTRIFRRLAPHQPSPDVKSPVGGEHDAMADPVAGWLVVVTGPGQGQVLTLGLGQNTIGRGEAARARLNFGDDQVTRESHCIVTYDARGRTWYLDKGTGKNLAYVNDKPVLGPMLLEPMQRILLGRTCLCFVPFCSQAFDWQDYAK